MQQTAKNMVALSELSTGMKLNTIHVESQLSKITCPTLIINGEDAFYCFSSQLAHQVIQNWKLVIIEGAGHYPFIEQRELFYKELNKFIIETSTDIKANYE